MELISSIILNLTLVAMECLPIFLEKLVPPFFAVAISVTLVLFFGEFVTLKQLFHMCIINFHSIE